MTTITYLQSIINTLPLAVAFFNAEQKLLITNKLLFEMWNLDNDTLDSNTDIIEFFEILREQRLYPEKDNFKEFRKDLLSLFSNPLDMPLHNHLILVNGKNIEEKITKESGGILFTWEDKTNLWDITYNLNSHKNIFNRIVEKHPEAVIVVGTSGLIEHYNTLFSALFNLKLDFLQSTPHITNFFKEITALYDDVEGISYLIGNSLNNKIFSIIMQRLDNIILKVQGFPLPNGSNFIIFQNIAQSEQTSYLNQEALGESLKSLQQNFLQDFIKIADNPLISIIGFADLLKHQYVGTLNHRQQEYTTKIITQAEYLKQELNYKLELAIIEESNQEILKESIDLNAVIAYVLHQIKPRLLEKSLNLKLKIPEALRNITSNADMLQKILTLSTFYLITQNNFNSILEIEISQSTNITKITLRDNATSPLLSTKDLQERFDLNLALTLIKKLGGTYDSFTRNRQYRNLVITFST